MKSAFSFLLLSFYLFGTLILPMGDFSVLPDLPRMYAHCRDTEDRDLNVVEFLTEHLSGIGSFGAGMEHDEEDEEPGDHPHAPVQCQCQMQIVICSIATIVLPSDKPMEMPGVNPPLRASHYISTYIADIFRPPVA